MEDNSSPVCVHRAGSVGEAQVIRVALEEEGISAEMIGENLPYAGSGAVPIEIYVAAADGERAKTILAAHRSPPSGDS